VAIRIDTRAGDSTANVLTAAFEPAIEQPIELYDNTLREGEQPPGVWFTADEKLAIAGALDAAGVHWANVGFPAVSEAEAASVRAVAGAGLRMKTSALARMLRRDIEITAETGVDMISLFLGGSDVHLAHKYQMTESDALARIEDLVPYAKSSGKVVCFCIEDGSRTPMPRLVRMFQTAEAAGADYVVLADTVGVLTPPSTQAIVGVLRSLLQVPIGVHFHDDLGLSLANTLAALQAGAQMAHVTVNGVGERAGNACLEELAVVLAVKYGRDLGLSLDRLYDLSARVHRASGTEPPAHKAITGKWCFTHESGIHVAGILAEPETYQPYPPALVGRAHELVFGKHSGARSVRYWAEQNGIALGDAACRAVLEQIKRRGKREGGPVSPEQVLAWIRAEAG
jgi:isopropylmalate/homocitrate/citramalate synthase